MTCATCGTAAAAGARFCSRCGGRLDELAVAIAPDVRERVLTTLRAEHRLVTVVFTDMAGSVRRTRDLDAEGAITLVNPLLETMVELMVQHGGRIDRFLGDGVLAVFGVPYAHEDDPIRAVRAAVGLRERAAEIGLEITAGVNTGRVYFGPVGSSLHEELTVMGPVVNLAARLQGAARAGEVLIGSSTRDHTRAWFDLTSRTVDVKGIDEPVTAFVVDRLAADPAKVRGIEGLTSQLVGRDLELDRLRSALEDGTTTVAIVGRAGLGKSRLAREFRAVCSRRWIEGRCQSLTADVPFSGFVDLLARHFGESGPAQIRRTLSSLPALSDGGASEIAPFLSRLLASSFEDAGDVSEIDPELRRRLTIDAIVRWIGAIAEGDPVVVFIDDLHWADPLTIETLGALDGASSRVLTVVATRPEPDRPLAALHSATGGPVDVVHLTALSKAQTVELVRDLLEVSGLPHDTETRLVGWAEGNPFYIEELIRSFIDREMLVRRADGWEPGPVPVNLELPESIDGLVMSRFDRLQAIDRRAGQVAAVLDRPFTDDLFRAVAGDAPTASLGTLIAAEFLRRSGDVVAFTHDLVREAVYGSLLPSQKLELHELVAEAIARSDPGDHESLAHHYDRSSNHRRAVEHLHAAALGAFEAYANETASAHLDRAMTRIEDLPQADRNSWRAACLVLRAQLRERATDHVGALSDLHHALDLTPADASDRADILRFIGRAHHMSEQLDLALEAFDAAEELVDRTSDPSTWLALQADRAQALYFGGRGRELPELIESVRPVVAAHGTASQRSDLLGLEAFHRFVSERFALGEETVSVCREALRLSEASGDPGRLATARFRMGFCLLWADRAEESIEHLEAGLAGARRIGDVMAEVRGAAYLAIALRRAHRVDDALRAADEAHAIAEGVDDRYYMGHADSVRGWAEWRLGDADAARGHLLAALDQWGPLEREGHVGPGSEFPWLVAWPLCALDAEAGDHAAASDQLALVEVPWGRPQGPELADAVAAARRDPSADSIARALLIAERHDLL